jgi:hypothetical protein
MIGTNDMDTLLHTKEGSSPVHELVEREYAVQNDWMEDDSAKMAREELEAESCLKFIRWEAERAVAVTQQERSAP